ncbi:MAG: manganese efflux pump [Alicyclobacillus macrosporangiidus]|uniref:manganese efflux pump MntP n=1 Tax=Alicyclobacillus macrosporangiidus TaxID=392015 RepID=UPI0026EE8AC4|nr:manganese efflux pump [Alicyclobacillus macrosporangiidus]MCL6597508.1 manganese efflux pump [Alicyclobacillus macrosporangiidus]
MDGWPHLVSYLALVSVIGIGSNIDNTGVGAAYGSAGIRFPHWVNGIVNGIGFAFSVAGAWAGNALAAWVPLVWVQMAACFVLCGLGWYLLCSSARLPEAPIQPPLAAPGWREGIALGVALSATNVASGASASLTTSLPTWTISVSISVWGYLCLWLGNRLAHTLVSRVLGTYGGILAGVVLMVLGIRQLV